jgi:hypothetical protein
LNEPPHAAYKIAGFQKVKARTGREAHLHQSTATTQGHGQGPLINIIRTTIEKQHRSTAAARNSSRTLFYLLFGLKSAYTSYLSSKLFHFSRHCEQNIYIYQS